MNAVIPDVSASGLVSHAIALDWVGMEKIDLPVVIDEEGVSGRFHAHADVQVDLSDPVRKGIHMSRLYQLLDVNQPLSPAVMATTLQQMVRSHEDCGSKAARIRLEFPLLLRRSALLSEGMGGWKSYPVTIEASDIGGTVDIRLQVGVTYSSTCPCSAALSRQIIQQAFTSAFSAQRQVSTDEVAGWLQEHATVATPHSQRSEAFVEVVCSPQQHSFRLFMLIEAIEQALATPVQTAVKRQDEQAFAELNGQNLMFVEDAARRINKALSGRFSQPGIYVKHYESLHAHDAVARTGYARERVW